MAAPRGRRRVGSMRAAAGTRRSGRFGAHWQWYFDCRGSLEGVGRPGPGESLRLSLSAAVGRPDSPSGRLSEAVRLPSAFLFRVTHASANLDATGVPRDRRDANPFLPARDPHRAQPPAAPAARVPGLSVTARARARVSAGPPGLRSGCGRPRRVRCQSLRLCRARSWSRWALAAWACQPRSNRDRLFKFKASSRSRSRSRLARARLHRDVTACSLRHDSESISSLTCSELESQKSHLGDSDAAGSAALGRGPSHGPGRAGGAAAGLVPPLCDDWCIY
jgi:hypothetical protein